MSADILNGNDSKPKACVECAHHSFERIVKQDDYSYIHYCERPLLRDLVTGKKSLCLSNRQNQTLCGWHAKHYTPKEIA